jgi:hypothetical protein
LWKITSLKELPQSRIELGQQSLETNRIFKTTSQSIQLNWLTGINTTEEGKVVVLLTKNGALFDEAEVTLNAYLWMKSMGHGSSPIVITKLTTGIYQLSELYFTMTGDWQLHLTLSKNNSIIDEVEFMYDLTL